MMKMEYKLLGFDLDGTILTGEKKLTARTKRALEEAIAQGMIVLPATGRPFSGIPKEIMEVKGIRYALTSNGARIVDAKDGSVVYEKPVPKEITEKILDIYDKYDTLQEIYFQGVGYISEHDLQRVDQMMESPAMAEYVRSTRKVVKNIRETARQLPGGVDKVHAIFADQSEKMCALRELEQMGQVTVTRALSNNIEVNAEGVDKGKGMLKLAELLGIRREEMIVFGDGWNDISMIHEAGCGVAMGNAQEAVKEAADLVTDSNEEDGVAKIIEKIASERLGGERMLEMLKVILLGIVEGITEWLPISSTGHLILVDEFIKLQASAAFKEMFNVVIQLGAIMAVVVLYFHKLNPFSPKKTQKQKAWTIQLWMKVIVACIPAGVIGILFDDWMEAHLHKPEIISAMLILYGILFIVVENWNKGKMPKVTKLSQLSYQTALLIGGWQVLSLIPGTSRSGATIVGAPLLGTSRYVAAEFTFFLAIPVMFGASFVKILKFGLSFTAMEAAMLLVGCLVAFVVSVIAIKFLMGYIKKNDFKVFGYYRIILGALVLLYFTVFA